MKIKLCLSTLESRENPSGVTGDDGDFWGNAVAAAAQGAGNGFAHAGMTESMGTSTQTGIGTRELPVDNNPMPDVPPMGPPWWPNGVVPVMMSPTGGETEGWTPPVASPPVQPPSTPPVDQLAPPSID